MILEATARELPPSWHYNSPGGGHSDGEGAVVTPLPLLFFDRQNHHPIGVHSHLKAFLVGLDMRKNFACR